MLIPRDLFDDDDRGSSARAFFPVTIYSFFIWTKNFSGIISRNLLLIYLTLIPDYNIFQVCIADIKIYII